MPTAAGLQADIVERGYVDVVLIVEGKWHQRVGDPWGLSAQFPTLCTSYDGAVHPPSCRLQRVAPIRLPMCGTFGI